MTNESHGPTLTLQAHAKINLSLDVLHKRRDGYHHLCMIMQEISLHDEVHLRLTPEPGIRLTTNAGFLPVDQGNIAWKAAERLARGAGVSLESQGVAIHIDKQIPVAAGLAGGSADAAAVLKGLNALWRLGLSLEELQLISLPLGADIPYCLMGGTALAEGIGERLTPLTLAKPFWVVLVKPPVSVSTREVYEALKLDEIEERPDTLALIEALAQADSLTMAGAMANVLETVTIPQVPEIGELKRRLLALNATASLMSGSGPTVFGLFKDQEKARSAGEKLKRLYREVHVVHTLRRSQ
ncbi:4-(cytidine 5'-diphospho)-2-C-methyl-D-erythritol kinase [Anoxynatronum buryatiense]|uniref:4-diphosphocytidyl-2-C-methyl-D-erythritol kinase n=1 Tax=Anoxynatronum buryatiense TaxID=489973 RepID=A0AA46AJG0_9CLOT|nr:4-(cytidine 5'-diphospho)-2-C-methyl-D-erythritol kinase [Anoxynatronum buryatiense]SMP60173.1 4-diphosphocytidyl-2-C-methyl-D-erythritol kinase [Anoxynatronum buryatiense]